MSNKMAKETEVQVLIGRERNSREQTRYYQVMIDWKPMRSTIEYGIKNNESPEDNQFNSKKLAEFLKERDIERCRIYNGISYNHDNRAFKEILPIDSKEEIYLRKTINKGGILVEKNGKRRH